MVKKHTEQKTLAIVKAVLRGKFIVVKCALNKKKGNSLVVQ